MKTKDKVYLERIPAILESIFGNKMILDNELQLKTLLEACFFRFKVHQMSCLL